VTQSTFTDDEGQLWVPVVPNTLAVYRNLRIGLAVTAVMLASSIIIQSTYMPQHSTKRCWQGALSEYFYTSAHSIFIAALLGLATLFFIYRGTSDTENALFKLGGIAAFVAALVPQPKPPIDRCRPLFLPDDFEVDLITQVFRRRTGRKPKYIQYESLHPGTARARAGRRSSTGKRRLPRH